MATDGGTSSVQDCTLRATVRRVQTGTPAFQALGELSCQTPHTLHISVSLESKDVTESDSNFVLLQVQTADQTASGQLTIPVAMGCVTEKDYRAVVSATVDGVAMANQISATLNGPCR